MKRFLGIILILLLLLIVLTYWSVSVYPEEERISEVISKIDSGTPEEKQDDSVVVITSNLYDANSLKRFMQGVNYRKAWAAPIEAPVLYLEGFKILEEGGGKQTHSLDLEGPGGEIFSLRSVNKDPEALIPKAAKTLGLENIVIDGISAQHPFGAILAAALADAAGILHTHPKIVFLPEQELLGEYNEKYGNRLFLLEYETEGEVNWTSLPNVIEIMDTDNLQELKMEYQERVKIDHRALVRARMFDMLIGDWDRHAKQWGWVVQKEGEDFIAFPLGGDRDNAFFRIDGVIPTILTNELVQPLVRPFEEDIDHVPGFVYPVDVYFLHSTPEEVFVEESKLLQKKLSDEKIEEAFRVWPDVLNDLNKEEIIKKLKKRRDKLPEYAREFRRTIEKRDVLKKPLKGSEDLELPENLQKCFEC
ncbi:hypothetical protein [Salinimicrobium flavum]|uniref:Uncharacterized protein n=1 Tax=Salinimicrobium flavum TaxID=1737065 RepID=A0ABW5J0X6_9FLAO